MLELLLTTGGGALPEYPNSGPDPKRLRYGDETLGYFGEVTKSELFTTPELRTELDFYAGSEISFNTWVKMFLDSKVIFFPLGRIANALSWNDLYNSGLVYGVDNTGVVPGTVPTNQLKYTFKNKELFKVRLFKGSTEDPTGGVTGPATPSASTPQLINSEWFRVLGALCSEAIPGYTGNRFSIYDKVTLNMTTTTQTTRWDSRTQYVFYAANIANIYEKSIAGSSWVPVLELVPQEEAPVLAVDKINSFGGGDSGFAFNDGYTTTDELLPIIRVTSVTNVVDSLIGSMALEGEYPLPISSSSVRTTVDLNAPLVPSDFTYE